MIKVWCKMKASYPLPCAVNLFAIHVQWHMEIMGCTDPLHVDVAVIKI